jgi:hypothetical protein
MTANASNQASNISEKSILARKKIHKKTISDGHLSLWQSEHNLFSINLIGGYLRGLFLEKSPSHFPGRGWFERC